MFNTFTLDGNHNFIVLSILVPLSNSMIPLLTIPFLQPFSKHHSSMKHIEFIHFKLMFVIMFMLEEKAYVYVRRKNLKGND